MMKLNRRIFGQAALLIAGGIILSTVSNAHAGSYLSRAAVLLKGAELEAKTLRARFRDKELAKATHRLAQTRTRVAQEMQVPQEVTRAHPHLLLVLESYERAADGAMRGDQEDLLLSLARAREEASIFLAVLKRGGWVLPPV